MRSGFKMCLIAACLLLFAGCGEDRIRDVGDSTLEATFRVDDETFKVRITNSKTIEDIVDVWQRTSSATIPNGALLPGSGDGDYNKPWSWHLDSEDIEMAEVTTEVCSAKPSEVEANLDEWLNNVRRYCPWSAELIALRSL